VKASYGEVWSRVARAVPDRLAIVAGELELTYRDFDERAARFAAQLSEPGIGRHRPVAVFMYNRVEYMTALFATLKIGATIVPINFRYGGHEAAGLLNDSEAEALIFPTSLEATVADALDEVDRAVTLVRVDDDREARPRLDAIGFDDRPAAPLRRTEATPRDGELYLFTGGTTGHPKAVVWPIDALLEIQLFPIYTTVGLDVPTSVDAMVAVARDLEEDAPVVLPLAPFMHGTALFNSMNAFVLGGTLVILPSARFDAHHAVREILDRHVTRLVVAGDAVAIPLLDAANDLGITALPTVRTAISSGMRFSDAVKARLHALGSVSIADVLAATEGGPFAVATSTTADDLPAPLALLPGAVVLDEAYDEIQDVPGAVGLLAYRGTLPNGYLRDDEKNAAAYPIIRGVRHLVSGDYVRVRADGDIELLGRGSSVINTGGEKIYPAEIEEALLAHPAVTDAVVFGMPDPRWGEAVTALVAAPSQTVTEQELVAHVGGLLARYKKPKRVLVRDAIERSPSGKVDMGRIRRDALRSTAGTE
jgi:fatty-acyl-CoA synthase